MKLELLHVNERAGAPGGVQLSIARCWVWRGAPARRSSYSQYQPADEDGTIDCVHRLLLTESYAGQKRPGSFMTNPVATSGNPANFDVPSRLGFSTRRYPTTSLLPPP